MEMNRKVIELNIDDVLPNRFQPRIKFSEDAITELSNSIKEHGVIQPIVVRPIGDKYEIIAGERRYKASCMAGLQTIPAIITDLNDKDSAEVALIENVQRENLTPIEEAISYKKILDMGYITQEALAAKLGKTQSTIANKLRLLNLDDEVQEALLKEKISERHARSLLKLSDKEQQRQMLKRIIEERLPVRRADEEIEKLLNGEIMDNKTEELIESSKDDILEELPKDNEKPTFKFINFPVEEENEEQQDNITPEPNEQDTTEELKPSKFFNILNENEEETEEPQNEFNFDKIFMNPTTSSSNVLMDEINEIESSINNSNKQSQQVQNATNKPIQPIERKENIEEETIDDFDDFDADFEPINDEEIENVEEEPETNNQPRFITPRINNFKDVLQSIRSVSDDIEKSGYKIETEEYDLEGMYQVVFKITKD